MFFFSIVKIMINLLQSMSKYNISRVVCIIFTFPFLKIEILAPQQPHLSPQIPWDNFCTQGGGSSLKFVYNRIPKTYIGRSSDHHSINTRSVTNPLRSRNDMAKCYLHFGAKIKPLDNQVTIRTHTYTVELMVTFTLMIISMKHTAMLFNENGFVFV